MARQRYSDLLDRVLEAHHLECPRCHYHSIVSRGESRYVCLNCGWRRNGDAWGGFQLSYAIRTVVCQLLLFTLPLSYRETAREVYWETTTSNYLFNAYQYFIGGLEYRARSVRTALYSLLSAVRKFFDSAMFQ